MIIDQARFDAAITIGQFVAQMQSNQDLFTRNYELTAIGNADLAFFRAHEPLRVLALANDWCIDVMTALPALARLAALLGDEQFKLRVLLDEGNEDIIEAYPKAGGQLATPVFVFFDAHMRERGHLVERPAPVSTTLNQVEAEFVAAHPGWPAAREQRSEEQKSAIGERRREYRINHYPELAQILLDAVRQLLNPLSHPGAGPG